jgi:hypothetical protein
MVNSDELIVTTPYVMLKESFALTDVMTELGHVPLCHKGGIVVRKMKL